MTKPVILLSNDDGYHAPGLNALADVFEKDAEVWVVAPHTERSGAGQGLRSQRRFVLKNSHPGALL